MMRKRDKITAGVIALGLLTLSGCNAPGARRTGDDAPSAAPAPDAPAVNARLSQPGALALPQLETTLSGIYDRVSPSVVNIQVAARAPEPAGQDGAIPMIPGMPGFPFFGPQRQPDGEPPLLSGSGSGFVWDANGHIVTNNHVVANAERVRVTFSDGATVTAKLVGADPDSDLAVVKVDLPKDRLPGVQLADSSQVKVGQLAVAIGNPFGLEGTMTVGFISALGRLLPLEAGSEERGGYSIPDMIQTDAPINPGNSGGVLTNSSGQVIGVTSAIISPARASAGIGFAIPSAIVQKVVPTLITGGTYQHAWLGVSGLTLSPDLAKAMNLPETQRGALVVDIIAGSPADKAGLRGSGQQGSIDGQQVRVGGDVVVRIENQEVKRFDDIVAYLARSTEVGQTVALTVLRGGKEVKVPVTLAARPGAKSGRSGQANRPQPTRRAWLGIGGMTLDEQVARAMSLPAKQTGVLVGEVESGSPADRAGLRGSSKLVELDGESVRIGGDVIVSVDKRPLQSLEQLQQILAGAEPGRRLVLGVLRDGKTVEVTVTLAALPR